MTRAIRAAEQALGQRLTDSQPLDIGGEPARFFACTRLQDRELTYDLWVWVTRRTPEEDGR
jgi:hypothetical protein